MTYPSDVRSDWKRGPLSDAEKSAIERLCAEMHEPTPGKVARRLNRHPSTIHWQMIRRGLWSSPPRRAARPYRRNGKIVHPFSEEHDARIEQLRIEGKRPRAIAEIITQEFGIHRSEHSVGVRLVLLASYTETEAAE